VVAQGAVGLVSSVTAPADRHHLGRVIAACWTSSVARLDVGQRRDTGRYMVSLGGSAVVRAPLDAPSGPIRTKLCPSTSPIIDM